MADAIHEITSSDSVSLQDIAALYYALGTPGGSVDVHKRDLVIRSIRARTGSVLDGVQDSDTLSSGTVLRIPTLRKVATAIFAEGQLLTDLMAAGYDHADKLQSRRKSSVVDMLAPYGSKPYGQADVRRAYVLTRFLDLDGMDRRTAIHLYDVQQITDMPALASLSTASLQSILLELVGKGLRPQVLIAQGHAERWRTSARIITRTRVSRRTERRTFQVPFAKAEALRRAEHYEAINDGPLAPRLGYLHRFQAYLIEGNVSVLAKNWGQAVQAFQAARRQLHRLAEDLGTVSVVDDERGLTLDETIATVYELLKTMPQGQEAPLGAPRLRLKFGGMRRIFKLDGDQVSPDSRALELPSHNSAGTTRVLLSQSFVEDYKTQFLNPHLGANANGAIYNTDVLWIDSATFAALVPYYYCGPIVTGLGQAYANLGQGRLANQYGMSRFDIIDRDGNVLVDSAALQDYLQDLDLFACSTDFLSHFEGPPAPEWARIYLPDYIAEKLAEADANYRVNRRDTAHTIYSDVICAIENYWESIERPWLRSDAQAAFGATANAALDIARGIASGAFRTAEQLSLLVAGYSDGSRVVEDYVSVVGREPEFQSFEETVDAWKPWFFMDDPVPQMIAPVVTRVSEEQSGRGAEYGGFVIYVDTSLADDEHWFEYVYARAKLQALRLGLNWYGFSDTHVPVWSYEHLDAQARDLLSRAVDAERQVFQLLQLLEQAEEKEFLAQQQLQLAVEQLGVARQRVLQQEAANELATAQAGLSVRQAEAAAAKSATRAVKEFDANDWGPQGTGEIEHIPTSGAGMLAVIGQGLSAVPFVGGVFSAGAGVMQAQSDHVADLQVLEEAWYVAQATQVANAQALALAVAERDVAQLQAVQANEYVNFLAGQTLNSSGFEQLLRIAREVQELYWYQAHRMAWLAQQAVEYAHRRGYNLIRWDYETGSALHDMMKAQRLFADLDALRGDATAGQRARMQEIRWTIPLSRLDPAALMQLRETGSCSFVLRQERVDREFPGTYLHSLSRLQLQAIGTIPPGGLRGVLSMSGASWVRVPNSGVYATGETKPDWTTETLADSVPYDGYVMKRLFRAPSDLSLSEFDVTRDGGVLSVPAGMLRVLEGLGLDTAWSLDLPRRSNDFVFQNIRDVELTFWFLCAYDPKLHAKQDEAMEVLGASGRLEASARLSVAVQAPAHWAAFMAPAPEDGVDARQLTWDITNTPPDQMALLVQNVRVIWGRWPTLTDEITFRICCDTDPIGKLVTTDEGGALTLIGVDPSEQVEVMGELVPLDPDPPTESTDLREWLRDNFFDTSEDPNDDTTWVPTESPAQRWVIRVDPEHVGDAWVLKDEDGAVVTTDKGALTGGGGSRAIYGEGSTWKNYRVQVRVRTNGGTAELRIHSNGTDSYHALVLSSSSIALKRVRPAVVPDGLGAFPKPIPDDEFVDVSLSIYTLPGSSAPFTTKFTVEINGIAVINAAEFGGKGTGTIELYASGSSPVEFDDLTVVRLTSSGEVREVLLDEPFTAELPTDWTFHDGSTPWSISPDGHKRLDLRRLHNLVLTVDYRYEHASVQAGS